MIIDPAGAGDAGPKDRPRILHISADFPDPINPIKTPVIERLIELTNGDFHHQVFSLNRRSPSFAELGKMGSPHRSETFDQGVALEYLAPPFGLFHRSSLNQLADRILSDWIGEPLPNLIVGYKLTVEGLVAERLAAKLGVPFALAIQGNTDLKILRARPDLRQIFSKIYHSAAVAFPFAPWARDAVEKMVGERTGPTRLLPCPTQLDKVQAPVSGGSTLISVFHLRNHKVKNLRGLTQAMEQIAADKFEAQLSIYGGGSDADLAASEKAAAGSPRIAFEGPRTSDELATVMNQAIALVMPSHRESFGLVFLEALFAGLPIIYPKGASVDGYFDNLPFALPVNAGDPASITQAIKLAVTNEAVLKSRLRQWQDDGGLAPFTRAQIAETFAGGLREALQNPKP